MSSTKLGIKQLKVPFDLYKMLKFNPRQRFARDTSLKRSNKVYTVARLPHELEANLVHQLVGSNFRNFKCLANTNVHAAPARLLGRRNCGHIQADIKQICQLDLGLPHLLSPLVQIVVVFILAGLKDSFDWVMLFGKRSIVCSASVYPRIYFRKYTA